MNVDKKSIENVYGKRVTNIRIGAHNQTGRKACRIYFSDGTRKHSLFSRLLYEIYIGRVLDKDETVDHIDGDPFNDSVENLQILSQDENRKKGPKDSVKINRSKNNSKLMLTSFGDYTRGENSNLHKLTEKEVREIKELQKSFKQGSCQDKILAEKYNVTCGAIKQIRLNITWKHIVV